jgi:hypothetical protein
MAKKHVPLFVLVLLGAAATFPGVAVAEEEEDDPRCQVQMCADGVAGGQCRTSLESGGDCNDRCISKGCDGGSQVGGSFGCPTGNPFLLCQCGSCIGGGGGTGGGTGGGGETGGGGTCHEGDCWLACFEDYACMNFESYCQFGECWCEVYPD